MYRALAVKEFREVWWIGAIASALLMLCVLNDMGLMLDSSPPFLKWVGRSPTWVHPVPFRLSEWPPLVLMFAGAAGLVFGLWQTLGESLQGTWIFYLHRPAERRNLILAKVAAGLACLLVALGLPLVLYAIWAAVPGTHASPFEWWMTGPTAQAWGFAGVAYLAAFLSGLRPARWWVSRFFPLVFALFLWVPIVTVPWLVWPGWVMILVADAVLLAAIVHAGNDRDFA